MKKYDSKFTILITPKYSPSAKKDIEDEKIVILSSMALSEMIRNFIKYEDKPNFKDFYDIIESLENAINKHQNGIFVTKRYITGNYDGTEIKIEIS